MVWMKDKPLDGLTEAEGVIGDGETSKLGHPGSPPLLQTMALKAKEVQCPQCLQYHPSQIAQMDPDILDKARGIRRNMYEYKPPHL